MQSGESRGAEHTFLAWTGDGAAPATKRLTLLTSRGLHRLPTLCVFFMTRATQRPKTYTTVVMGSRADKNRLLRIVLSVVIFV